MRTWPDNEVQKLGQPQRKRRKAACERFTENINSIGERAENLRVNQVNKTKCREEA